MHHCGKFQNKLVGGFQAILVSGRGKDKWAETHEFMNLHFRLKPVIQQIKHKHARQTYQQTKQIKKQACKAKQIKITRTQANKR